MGFSGDGHTLIAYASRAASGLGTGEDTDAFVVELYACHPPLPLRRVLCLPLFNCEHGSEFGGTEVCKCVWVWVLLRARAHAATCASKR
jgi:hypothetical protein